MSLLSRLKKLMSDTKPPAPDDLVVIKTFPTSGEAYIAKGLLAANGIPSIVSNEVVVYTPQMPDSISLQIFYRDWDSASRILENM